MVAYACQTYEPSSVLLAAVATLAATLGLTYYAMTTKEDFTSVAYIGKGIFFAN
jgi:FtsH-binding integral membrane protein